MSEASLTTHLFVYGTLMPVDPADPNWSADRVRGRLFDLGPYPALVDAGDPSADWVDGFVRPVSATLLDGPLDDYEGVDEGLYRRVLVTTEQGVWTWVYVYARPLLVFARGPIPRWEGRRGAVTWEEGFAVCRFERVDPA